MVTTKGSSISSAEICRLNHWEPGTVLEATDNGVVERITITWVGRYEVHATRGDGSHMYPLLWESNWHEVKR